MYLTHGSERRNNLYDWLKSAEKLHRSGASASNLAISSSLHIYSGALDVYGECTCTHCVQ